PPVLAPIGNKTVQAGTNLSFSIMAHDPDTDALTYNATGLPAGATSSYASTTILPGGTVVWQPPGTPSFSWTPTSSQVGSHTVTFTIRDSRGKTASETITVTVTNPPTSPSPAPSTTMSPTPALSGFSQSIQTSGGSVILTLTVTLTAAPTSDVLVLLTVAPSNPGGFPPSLTVPAGSTTATDQIDLGAPGTFPGSGQSFTLTAQTGAVTRTVNVLLP